MSAVRPASPSGVLVVDKPSGMTSHDVVARVRRALRTREVGHTGTLDPMATGVLVVAIGEATKLVPYLTADDKAYVAEITFGRATDTLDAEGTTTREGEVPADLESAARGGPGVEEARTEQVPPAFSAITWPASGPTSSRDAAKWSTCRPERSRPAPAPYSRRAHRPRRVRVSREGGYYVRALARDLARSRRLPSASIEPSSNALRRLPRRRRRAPRRRSRRGARSAHGRGRARARSSR
ncbi:MAG: hypothetical protein U0235_27260 [Polyangiaceae bacterium]